MVSSLPHPAFGHLFLKGEGDISTMLKHKEHLNRKKTKLISLISFFLGFSQAVLLYVMSTYFKEASGTENVGGFYFIAYAILLCFLLNLHKLTRKLGKKRTAYFSLLIGSGILTQMFFVRNPIFIILVVFAASFGLSFATPAIRAAFADYIEETMKYEIH